MKRSISILCSLSVVAGMLVAPALTSTSAATPADVPAREAEAVVLTGAQLPTWSRLPAEGTGKTYPSGSTDGVRDAHNGELTVPEDVRTGVEVDQIVAYKWTGGETDGRFVEVPVQVDERFPYFLANARSDFAFYSGTDKELTYEWDVESWKKMFGTCEARYAENIEEVQAAIAAEDIGALGGSTLEDMLDKMEDPVRTFDDDDELVFMASDAGARAPLSVGPPGTGAERQEIAITDPRDPANVRFMYLFTKPGGSSFDEDNGYVDYQRHDNADQWIDRTFYANTDPEKLGTSNTGYGPNLRGTVCDEAGTPRRSNDRFSRDGVTVTTEAYKWTASGRWMVRGMQVRKPGTDPERGYGQDLIDRWKGRAFQQSPDSQISVVGFEDEQVNWEGNSALIGELEGPVRAIRETWGADSGTNVTKTETFYRNAVHYRYRVRVHPIPPDGLYTSWDYNQAVADTYYNESLHANQADPAATTVDGGVPIDGINDEILGNVDGPPGAEESFPFYFDAPDPTLTKPLAFFNWEQVSGKDDNGSLVYMFEMKNAQSLENPVVTPYYRDDACLDDGTGDDPSPRPMPGDTQETAYPANTPCFTEAPAGYEGPYRQGCFGCHGVHYFFTHDTDNATVSNGGVNEIDGAQWQWAVPTSQPTNVGDRYANTVKTPLVAVAVAQASTPQDDPVDPGPAATTIEIVGDSAGQATDTATLAARLSDANGPVVGKELAFSLGGETVGAAVTDESGVASVQITLSGPARQTEQTAAFAGDDDHAPASTTGPFDVTLEDSTMEVGATRKGSTYTATARLTESDTAGGLGGRQVRFVLNGETVATATTATDGSASATFAVGKGRQTDTIEAIFDGDDTYSGSSASVQSRRGQ